MGVIGMTEHDSPLVGRCRKRAVVPVGPRRGEGNRLAGDVRRAVQRRQDGDGRGCTDLDNDTGGRTTAPAVLDGQRNRVPSRIRIRSRNRLPVLLRTVAEIPCVRECVAVGVGAFGRIERDRLADICLRGADVRDRDGLRIRAGRDAIYGTAVNVQVIEAAVRPHVELKGAKLDAGTEEVH